MASIQIWALRLIADKTLLGVSYTEFEELQSGQEQTQETIPEEDMSIFLDKYKFDGGGTLIINPLKFYTLDLSEDASSHNPATGYPQLDVGGVDYFTLDLQKKDIQGYTHTDPADDDKIYINANGAAIAADPATGLTRGFKTEVMDDQVKKVATEPVNVTGVVITSVSNDTPIGTDGELAFVLSGTLLSWEAPGEGTPGTGVNVGAGGDFTLYANGTGSIDVTVSAGSLPGSDQQDTTAISLNDTFVVTSEINPDETVLILEGAPVDPSDYTINDDEIVFDTAPSIGEKVSILYGQIIEGEWTEVDLTNGAASVRIYAGTSRGLTDFTFISEGIASAFQAAETI